MNADWYDDVDERRAHANWVIYVKSTVQVKAFDHLIACLKQFDKDETVTVEMCRQYLKRVFDDPDKRMKAREELHKLKLNYLGDFGAFYSEFVRLANLSRKAKDLWKEDIHDKLYASLRTHMELFVVDDGCDFETYCQKAQHFARGLGREGQARREAREAAAKKKRSKEPSSKAKPGDTAPQGKPSGSGGQRASDATPASGPQASDITCYGCGKKGHIRPNCPDRKGEAKVVGSDSEDFGSESENE